MTSKRPCTLKNRALLQDRTRHFGFESLGSRLYFPDGKQTRSRNSSNIGSTSLGIIKARRVNRRDFIVFDLDRCEQGSEKLLAAHHSSELTTRRAQVSSATTLSRTLHVGLGGAILRGCSPLDHSAQIQKRLASDMLTPHEPAKRDSLQSTTIPGLP